MMAWDSLRGVLSGLIALLIQVRCCPRQCLGLESLGLAVHPIYPRPNYPKLQFHSNDSKHPRETIDMVENAIVCPTTKNCAGSIYHNREVVDQFNLCGDMGGGAC